MIQAAFLLVVIGAANGSSPVLQMFPFQDGVACRDTASRIKIESEIAFIGAQRSSIGRIIAFCVSTSRNP